MMPMLDYVTQFGPWTWFMAAAILLALEMVVPGVHFLWFGVAAAVVGVLALSLAGLGAGLAWPVQVVIFAALSVATVFCVRRWARPESSASDEPGLNARAEQYLGWTCTVAEPIEGGRGRIKVGDTVWIAEGPDMPLGAQAKVTGARGTVLVVERVAG